MEKSIHLSTAKKIMDDKTKSFSIKVWELSTGEILEFKDVVCIKYNFRSGTRNIKFLRSGEIRTVRDVCVFEINGMPVYL